MKCESCKKDIHWVCDRGDCGSRDPCTYCALRQLEGKLNADVAALYAIRRRLER